MRPPRRPAVLPAKHLDRYRQIASVLADEGLRAIIDAAGLAAFVPGSRRSPRPDGVRLAPEVRLRQAIERLGVTFIKVGQVISTRTDIVPPTFALELRKLQDDVAPEPFAAVRSTVEHELEQSLEEAFASFDREPIAAASIGQVHGATLHDGTSVAVKVQRPGVREQVEVDLDIALTQVRWATAHVEAVAELNLVAVADEFAEAVKAELDYTGEGRNAERFWRTFRDDQTVAFPKVYWSHTTSRVLTMERFEGVRMNRLDALDASGCDRSLLAKRGIECYLRQIFEVGVFHADPHPGNFIALPGDRVAFTDFGRVGTLSAESRERFTDLLLAAVNRDSALAVDTFLAVSHGKDIDEAALERDITRLIDKYYGRALARVDPTELFAEVSGLIRDHHLGVASDFALAIATLGMLEGVGTALDPDFDFVSVAKPVAARIIRERSRPEVLLERFARGVARSGRVIEALPVTAERFLRRLTREDFRIPVAPTGYDALSDHARGSVNRLAFALVTSALIVACALLVGEPDAPQWLRTSAQAGLIAGFAACGWFFVSVIRQKR
ncbi:MAG: AarF/ABC1/UbiB kinase family protein [Actinomycetia bacterium]|nr:AarF/ABC1/UbiB kinase family protein [Actinomycetes bacterium]